MVLQRRLFWCERSVLVMSMLALIALTALMALGGPVTAFRPDHHRPQPASSHLADLALQKVLQDASPVFGSYEGVKSKTATWMKAYNDSTPIVHMNIPGTHDTATWNYSLATQKSLNHITDLVQDTEVNSTYWRCQTRSMADMLDAGIRVFDLRYAFDVTNSTLVFWHGPALQSETATVEDVLFGFYNWLDYHPSEAVFLSFQYQDGTAPNAKNGAGVQRLLYDVLTSPASKKYILQTRGTLGTLGEARGKVTLFRRFDLDKLPASYDDSLPGLHFSPKDWGDNESALTLVYNKTTSETAYIEDYYRPETRQGADAEENIKWKYAPTEAHFKRAAKKWPDSLFWGFASSNNIGHDPPITPVQLALGQGSIKGMNQRLIPDLKEMQGKRLGIVMFDFYETPENLIPTFLSLLPPTRSHGRGS